MLCFGKPPKRGRRDELQEKVKVFKRLKLKQRHYEENISFTVDCIMRMFCT